MSFFRRLFGGNKKRPVEAMTGQGRTQTDKQQRSSRSKTAAGVIADRYRRAADPGVPASSATDNQGTTAKEEAVIALVTQACAGMDLQTARVDVQKPEGGAVPTLRFILNGQASTDLELGRIAVNGEPTEVLAGIVMAELRGQMGPTSGSVP